MHIEPGDMGISILRWRTLTFGTDDQQFSFISSNASQELKGRKVLDFQGKY